MTVQSNSNSPTECWVCRQGDQSRSIIRCDVGKNYEHWIHTDCATGYAQTKRDEGTPDALITCPARTERVCRTSFAHLLPQKSWTERAVEFFRTRPVVQILAGGLPVLSLNEIGTAAVVAVGVVEATVGLGARAATLGLLAGILAVARGASPAEAALARGASAEEVAGLLAGVLVRAGIAGAVGANALPRPRPGEHLQLRDFIPAGLTTAGLASASVLLSGGGCLLAGTVAATSAVSTYCTAKAILFGA